MAHCTLALMPGNRPSLPYTPTSALSGGVHACVCHKGPPFLPPSTYRRARPVCQPGYALWWFSPFEWRIWVLDVPWERASRPPLSWVIIFWYFVLNTATIGDSVPWKRKQLIARQAIFCQVRSTHRPLASKKKEQGLTHGGPLPSDELIG